MGVKTAPCSHTRLCDAGPLYASEQQHLRLHGSNSILASTPYPSLAIDDSPWLRTVAMADSGGVVTLTVLPKAEEPRQMTAIETYGKTRQSPSWTWFQRTSEPPDADASTVDAEYNFSQSVGHVSASFAARPSLEG